MRGFLGTMSGLFFVAVCGLFSKIKVNTLILREEGGGVGESFAIAKRNIRNHRRRTSPRSSMDRTGPF